MVLSQTKGGRNNAMIQMDQITNNRIDSNNLQDRERELKKKRG